MRFVRVTGSSSRRLAPPFPGDVKATSSESDSSSDDIFNTLPISGDSDILAYYLLWYYVMRQCPSQHKQRSPNGLYITIFIYCKNFSQSQDQRLVKWIRRHNPSRKVAGSIPCSEFIDLKGRQILSSVALHFAPPPLRGGGGIFAPTLNHYLQWHMYYL